MNLKPIIAIILMACCFCGCGKKGGYVEENQAENSKKTSETERTGGRQSSEPSPSEIAVKDGSEIKDVLMAGDIAVVESVLVTAYCPCRKCCGKDARGITSRGRDAFKTRGVAVDPTVIPYGTIVKIPGAGEFIADDTGGAMRQDWRKRGIIHLDLRYDSHADALVWGKQILTVKFR